MKEYHKNLFSKVSQNETGEEKSWDLALTQASLEELKDFQQNALAWSPW
jgi:hypothetical protein